MDFSKQNLDSTARGIARTRQKNEVGIDEVNLTIEYFTRLDTYYKQNHTDIIISQGFYTIS
ncbi:MAG: hypothetical protein WA667_26285 [Candidatus Nitrosopolaris sp.]